MQGSNNGGRSSGRDQPGMVVPADQVERLLSTLKGYSDSCVKCKEHVDKQVDHMKTVGGDVERMEKLVKEMKRENARAEAARTKDLNEMKGMHADIVAAQEKRDGDVKDMEKEIARIERMATVVSEAKKICQDAKELFDRVETKESFVCTFVDVVKESERMTRLLYTRTVYAGTICREVANLALKTLESTIRLLQVSVRYSERRDDTMCDSASDGVSVTNSKSGIQGSIKDLLLKIRYLQHDVNDMDRTAQLMDNVRLLDTSLRAATGELNGICLDCDSVTEKRKRMEELVRNGMKFDRDTHRTMSEFDELNVKETDRRLKATGIEGSDVVSAVVTMLRKNGVPSPGEVPTEDNDEDIDLERNAVAASRSMGSSSDARMS